MPNLLFFFHFFLFNYLMLKMVQKELKRTTWIIKEYPII